MKKTKNKLINEKRIVFAFPHLALSIIFVVVPLLIVFAKAFMDRDNNFTLSNFARFGEAAIWRVIGNSFLMAFVTTLICLLLCYPLALALNRIKSHKTAVLVMLFVIPMWINSLLRIIAIKLLLEELAGMSLGFLLTLIGTVYDFMPFMLLPLYTVIANTDKSYIEASQDLGASPLNTLIRVRIPLSTPGIVSGILMVFMPTMSTFAISKHLGGADTVLFGQFINDRFENNAHGIGSAYSIGLMLLIAASMFIASRLSKGKATASGGVTV